jgi:hypothetical protein
MHCLNILAHVRTYVKVENQITLYMIMLATIVRIVNIT